MNITSGTHLEEYNQMIGNGDLFQNRIYSLPSVHAMDNVLHLELFLIEAPDLGHVN